jgi:two-component system chemotaxis sensor kinase CheA
MAELDELVTEFIAESRDTLDQLDGEFSRLEADSRDQDAIASIFRTIHTLKGTSGLLGFPKLEALTHSAETLLGRIRGGTLPWTEAIESLLLSVMDSIRSILANIEAGRGEDNNDTSELIAALSRQQECRPAGVDDECVESPEAEALAPIGQILIKHAGVSPAIIAAARDLQRQGDVRTLGEILVAEGVVTPAAAREALESQREARAIASGDTSARIEIALLDKLARLTDDLAHVRDQIVEAVPRDSLTLLMAARRLDSVTGELQELALRTRTQPAAVLWNRLPRFVRDLAESSGKQIRLELQGEATEIERTMVDALRDALTHIVRNCADHGIEQPAQRLAAGKPVQGCIQVRASHDDRQLSIEVIDDGAGIRLDRVREKALAMGMVMASEAARMDDCEIAGLIAIPGLSTADKVTRISGRGVGMDVVKTNVERIGGSLEIRSQTGLGTTVRIRIPNKSGPRLGGAPL